MESNNNGGNGIMLKSNDDHACNKESEVLSAPKKCLDFDLNVAFVETSNSIDEPAQGFSDNVPVPTLMGGTVNSEPQVQFQAPTMALSSPPQGVLASSHQVHAQNNNVQLASSGDGGNAGSRVGVEMLNNGANKRKFDSAAENVIDLTSPLTTDQAVTPVMGLQVQADHDGTTSRMISFRQGNVAESEADRDLDGQFIDYSYNKRHNLPRTVLRVNCKVDLLDDGYNWRKYGQKHIKHIGSIRSYYRCSTPGCIVRKMVERQAIDMRYLITTYEGHHNHSVPQYRKRYRNNYVPAIDDNNSSTTTTTNVNMNFMNVASSSNAAAPNINRNYPSLTNGAYSMMPFYGSSSQMSLNLNH